MTSIVKLNDLVYTQFGYGVLIDCGNKQSQIELQEQYQMEELNIKQAVPQVLKENSQQLKADDASSLNKEQVSKDQCKNNNDENYVEENENTSIQKIPADFVEEDKQKNILDKDKQENENNNQNQNELNNLNQEQIKNEVINQINQNQDEKQPEVQQNQGDSQKEQQQLQQQQQQKDQQQADQPKEQIDQNTENKQIDKTVQEFNDQNIQIVQKEERSRAYGNQIKGQKSIDQVNIVTIKLRSGAVVYCDEDFMQRRIRINIKTFFGKREKFQIEVSIFATVQQVKNLVIQKANESQSSFYNMRLIYPMGTILQLNQNQQTLEQYNIPDNANLLLLVQTTFNWDQNKKGNDIKLSNNNLTANKTGNSDYQSVLGNQLLSSGSHYFEVKIDKFVDEEDIFIGVATKDFDLYRQPTTTDNFWGYMCLCARKFGPGGQFDEYGYSAKIGDVIGILLDFKNGICTLSFYKNGSKCGVAFNNINEPVYPAVCLFYGEVQVTLDPRAPRPNS